MKRTILLIVLVLCFILYGCGKEEKTVDGVKVEELGIVKSDLGEDCLLMKAINNSKNTVTVFSTVKLLDSSKKELFEETGFINLYSGQTSYYIVEISGETKYDSYEVKNESELNLASEYKSIYKSVKLEELTPDDKETIKFKIDNNSGKEVSAKVLGMFYKDNKVIAASIGNCENVKNKEKCEDVVYIPVKSMDEYETISYDKVELSLMNVEYK